MSVRGAYICLVPGAVLLQSLPPLARWKFSTEWRRSIPMFAFQRLCGSGHCATSLPYRCCAMHNITRCLLLVSPCHPQSKIRKLGAKKFTPKDISHLRICHFVLSKEFSADCWWLCFLNHAATNSCRQKMFTCLAQNMTSALALQHPFYSKIPERSTAYLWNLEFLWRAVSHLQ